MRIVGILLFLIVVWMVADVAPLPPPQPSPSEAVCREPVPAPQRCGLPKAWVPTGLEEMLDKHAIWHESGGTVGARASLCHADLSGADLSDVSLAGADLRGAVLSGATLSRADLGGAVLAGADLRAAHLDKASLAGADFQGANLSGADLSDADGASAVLSNTRLDGVTAKGAKFLDARLDGVAANGTDLAGASLTSACLLDADLRNANLRGADLRSAMMFDATLDRADLSRADMTEADLSGTRLGASRLNGANLTSALWEATGRPDPGGMTSIEGIGSLTYRAGNGDGLAAFRAALADAGLEDSERQATYALQATRTRHLLAGDLQDKTVAVVRTILFDQTVGYGLEPYRALMVLLGLIPAFALVYGVVIHAQPSCLGVPGAIVAVSPRGTVSMDDGQTPALQASAEVTVLRRRWLDAYALGLYASLLFSLRIGLRADQPSPASLLSRLQAEPFETRAIGWARCIAGVQSILGLYLLGLWLLAIMARPFG